MRTDNNMLIEKCIKDIRYKRFLYHIYKAMGQVGRKIGSVIVHADDNNPLNIKVNERNYIIYLSYILGTIESTTKNGFLGNTYYINGEIYKQIQSLANGKAKNAKESFDKFRNEKRNNEENLKTEDYINVRPDFVIHASHDKVYDYKGQKLIIEAKTTRNLDDIDFCWDFLKLNVYVDEFKFANAIYMLVNTNKEHIEDMLNLYKNEIGYFCNDMKKIWFFVQDWSGKEMLPVEIYQMKTDIKTMLE